MWGFSFLLCKVGWFLNYGIAVKSKSVVTLGLDSSLRGVLEEVFFFFLMLLVLNIMVIHRSDHELSGKI